MPPPAAASELGHCPACNTVLSPPRIEPQRCTHCDFTYDWHTRVYAPRSRFGIWAVFSVLMGFQPALLQAAYYLVVFGALPPRPTLFFSAIAMAGWFWLIPRWAAILERRRIFAAATPAGLQLHTLTRSTTIPYERLGLLRVRFGTLVVEDRRTEEHVWLEFLTPTDQDLRSLLGDIDRARERYLPPPEQRLAPGAPPPRLPPHLRD